MAERSTDRLEEKIGHVFQNKDLLRQALTHRSYLNENPDWPLGHNERLEFLGDAVLELVTTEALYQRFPDKPEGEMTNWRAALVNATMLASVSAEIDLNDHVLLSRGEARDTGRARQYILANAIEALIGAIYLDGGYPAARVFIEMFHHTLHELDDEFGVLQTAAELLDGVFEDAGKHLLFASLEVPFVEGLHCNGTCEMSGSHEKNSLGERGYDCARFLRFSCLARVLPTMSTTVRPL